MAFKQTNEKILNIFTIAEMQIKTTEVPILIYQHNKNPKG